MSPHITFGPSAASTIIEAFGWTTNDDDIIVDEETEEPVLSFNNWEITIDELGGIVKGRHRDTVPLRDNFVDICDYVEWAQEQGEDVTLSEYVGDHDE